MARPRGNRKEARISVSFDNGDYAILCALARRDDVSIAWIVRRAVHDLTARERQFVDKLQQAADNSTMSGTVDADGRTVVGAGN